jgi:hypothetical protein
MPKSWSFRTVCKRLALSPPRSIARAGPAKMGSNGAVRGEARQPLLQSTVSAMASTGEPKGSASTEIADSGSDNHVAAQIAVFPEQLPVSRPARRLRFISPVLASAEPFASMAKIRRNPRRNGPVNGRADTSRIVNVGRVYRLLQHVGHDLQQEWIALRQPARQHNALYRNAAAADPFDDRASSRRLACRSAAVIALRAPRFGGFIL